MVACKILNSSISSTLATAIDQLRACPLISLARLSRLSLLSIFESARPSIGCCGSRITAAATTGPAKGPRPASSMPAIKLFIIIYLRH